MGASNFTVEQFRILALDKFSFLEANGFHRESALEETSSTSGSVVYLGKYLGFVFSLDVRDQCVDAQVVKVCDGQMVRNWEGGYSSGVFTHLVKHVGYRGRPAGVSPSEKSGLDGMIDVWVELLRKAGESLLSDRPESLPR